MSEARPAPTDGGQLPRAAPTSNQAGYDDRAQPWRFLALSRAYGPSRAFQVATKLGLFEALRAHQQLSGGQGMAVAEVARALGLRADPRFRGVADLLDLLVAEECLAREGDGPSALYSNTPDGERYLCPGSRDYIGGLVIINCDRSYPQFLFLEDSLRTGVQPQAAQALVPDILETFGGDGGDADAPARFAAGMTGANLATFVAFASKFDFSGHATLLDVGGSAGTLSCAVAAAQPHMRCVSADLAVLSGAAAAEAARWGLDGGRVRFEALDFFADAPFPAADVITMSMILHDWGLDKKLLLMRKAFAALPPGGAFVALDLIIDDARRANRWGLFLSLNMLAEFGAEGSFDYTFRDFQGWASEVGFGRTELLRLGGPASAAVAYKDG